MSLTEILRYKSMEDFGYGPNVMKKTKVCAQCGKMVGANVKRCPECGERLSRETLFDCYKRLHPCCYKCDTVLAPGSLYCPRCGRQVPGKAAGCEKGGG